MIVAATAATAYHQHVACDRRGERDGVDTGCISYEIIGRQRERPGGSGGAGAKGYNTTFVNSGSTISLSAEGGGGADALNGNKNGGSGAGADGYFPQTDDSGGTATAYTPTINSVTVGVKLGGDGGGNFTAFSKNRSGHLERLPLYCKSS